jgi:hypothetical protein
MEAAQVIPMSTEFLSEASWKRVRASQKLDEISGASLVLMAVIRASRESVSKSYRKAMPMR